MQRVLWIPGPGGPAEAGLVARAFGRDGGDLDLNFDQPLDRVITGLLAACLETADGQRFTVQALSDWTLMKRRQGLLAISVATNGAMREIMVDCVAPECGARLGLNVDLTALSADWQVDRVPLPGSDLALRLPTSTDLAVVAGQGEAALAEHLLLGPAPNWPDWREEADAALAEADPLGDLELKSTCPECGAPIAHSFAIEPYLVAELAGEAERLVDEVHVLAMAYHWSEPEILALPPLRRLHYIDRIREAWAA